MGEHTIREVLKRRSSATQRELQKRRDQIMRGKSSRGPVLVLAGVLAVVVIAAIYAGMLTSKITNRLAQDISQQSRQPEKNLSLNSVSAFLPNTLLAVTDPTFYDSASTSTSPVTRNLVRLYFPDVSGISARIMVVVAQLRFSRTQILEAYINDVPMGVNAGQPVVGFIAASQAYFQKPFAQLQPQEIALLVALAKNPEQNDPRRFPDKALASRNAVIRADVEQTVLSQDQGDALTKMPLGVSP